MMILDPKGPRSYSRPKSLRPICFRQKYLDTLIFTINSTVSHEVLEVYKFYITYADMNEDGNEYSIEIEKNGKN